MPLLGTIGGGSSRGQGRGLGGAALYVNGAIGFNYTGSTQNWTVPAGITKIKVFLWGAGGGAGGVSSASQAGGNGGGGGAIDSGLIDVTPGETLVITVGQGPSYTQTAAGTTINSGARVNAFGGGGIGGNGDGAGSNGAWGGAGGGASAIQRNSTYLAIAGGGGGGGGPGYPAGTSLNGGGGGTGTGAAGIGPSSSSYNAGAGSNGGGGGGGGGSGSSFNAGQGGVTSNGGPTTLPANGGTAINGDGRVPGNIASPYYPGGNIGYGGQQTTASGANVGGNNGYVYILY